MNAFNFKLTEMSHEANILITGATGSIGQELTKYLSSKGVRFRAMARSLEKSQQLAALPGAQLVEGDFEDARSLEKALAGIERVFLLTNSSERAEQQQSRLVDVARRTGVSHIVKLSQWAADIHSPVRFLRYHAVVEQKIEDSGMAYTFLRPNLFMQGLIGFRQSIVEHNQFFGAVGDAKVSLVDTRDIAVVAGEVLIGTGHENRIYNLTGPEALSHQQMAIKLSEAVGREIQFVDVPSDVLLHMLLSAGFPLWQAEGLVEDYVHYKAGEAAEVSYDIRSITAREASDFSVFAEDYKYFFTD